MMKPVMPIFERLPKGFSSNHQNKCTEAYEKKKNKQLIV